jgi:uncharacterized protein with FMN-binding domain
VHLQLDDAERGLRLYHASAPCVIYYDPMAPRSKSGKVANSLVAVSSAAVMAIYAAGYVRTRAAADRLEGQSEQRRPPAPRPAPAQIIQTAAVEVKPPAVSALPLPAVTPKPAAEKPVTAEAPSAAPEPISAPAAPEPAVPVAAPPPPPPPPAAPPPPPAPTWKDGTYTGWGTSRHGDIQAAVVIEGGKISSATIAQCLTRYSCSVIDRLPPEVAQRQSPEVDYISGATQSTNAFYYAVVDALSKAK